MPVVTTAAQRRLDDGAIPASVLEIDLPDGTTYRAARSNIAGPTSMFPGRARRFGSVSYGRSDRDFRLERPYVRVEVFDDPETRELTKLLRGEFARLVEGSPARVKAAIPGAHGGWLPEADWYSRFSGVVDKWEMPEPFVVRWYLRVKDDELWRTSSRAGHGRRRSVTADDFPTAPESSLGQEIPVLYGRKESTGTNVTGMVECIRVSTDGGPPLGELGKPVRYLVSEGRLPDVKTRWVGGGSQTALGNQGVDWFRENRNGRLYTTIGFTNGADPGEGAVVTVDAWGLTFTPTPSPDPADDSSVIKNPIEQLQHYLANFVFNDANDGTGLAKWYDPYTEAPLDPVTWQAARGYFVKKFSEASRLVPHQSVETTLRDIGASIQPAYYWTPEGKLAITIDDPHRAKDAIYEGVILRRGRDFTEDLFAFDPDVSQRTQRIRYSFFLADATNDFIRAGAVSDPSVAFGRTDDISMPWTQGRKQ